MTKYEIDSGKIELGFREFAKRQINYFAGFAFSTNKNKLDYVTGSIAGQLSSILNGKPYSQKEEDSREIPFEKNRHISGLEDIALKTQMKILNAAASLGLNSTISNEYAEQIRAISVESREKVMDLNYEELMDAGKAIIERNLAKSVTVE